MSSRLQQIRHHLVGPTVMSDELWPSVPLAQPDGIFKLTAAYKVDQDPNKVDLGVGAYRDNDGKPWVLPVIKKATYKLLDTNHDLEYLPITGLPEFTSAAAKLILGSDSPALAEGRVATAQTVSGTGANHLAALFFSKYYDFNGPKQAYISDPTWINHFGIFRGVGITPIGYPYYDSRTNGLNFQGIKSTLENAPPRSVILLHACGHNPTGADPTREEWKALAQVMIAKHHYAFFDCAYQGFASGDLDDDAWSVRYFVQQGIPMLVCQSFSKNAGLYSERAGALHMILPNKETADRVKSQLSALQRSVISNPPAHGARLVALILNDAELFEEWKRDIKTMANRIILMRKELSRLLTEEFQTPGEWGFITRQIGMFSYTGLTVAQTERLIDEAHVYLSSSGRASVAGLNTHNIRYFAAQMDRVVRGAP